jgi:hypothetical protein
LHTLMPCRIDWKFLTWLLVAREGLEPKEDRDDREINLENAIKLDTLK